MTEITVAGTAEASLPADLATIYANVSVQGPQREEVLRESYEAHAALIARAKQLVAEGAATGFVPGGVSTYSNSWRDERGEQVIEHRAQATLEVSVTALARVGELSAEFTESGADTRVAWMLLRETTERLTRSLRVEAVENARAAAADYAQTLGPSKLKILKIRDSVGGGNPSPFGEARMAVAAAPTPELAVGEISVSVHIEAVFEAVSEAEQ